tara:strand:+ start:3201 stop:3473 length:273 start_codon:yes stop_codon:yes gene_type:complete
VHGTYRHRADESHVALLFDKQRRGALDELWQRVGVDLVCEQRGLVVDLAGEVGGREELPLDQISGHDLGHLSGRKVAQLLGHHLAARRDR